MDADRDGRWDSIARVLTILSVAFKFRLHGLVPLGFDPQLPVGVVNGVDNAPEKIDSFLAAWLESQECPAVRPGFKGMATRAATG